MKKILLSSALIMMFTASTHLSVNAAIVDINQLNIETFNLNLNPSSIYPPIYLPADYPTPLVWPMGEYGAGVTTGSFDIPIFGSVYYTIESTGSYGALPPNGSVDTTIGIIDLDLSSLHIAISGVFVGDDDLWSPLTSTIYLNSYNHNDGTFHYQWSDTTTLQDHALGGGTSMDVDYYIDLTGTVEAVPIPASIWLFTSGLIGLIGVSRFKKEGDI